METGKVKFFNDTKGFGFITKDNGDEIFVHVSGLKDRNNLPQTDDEVEFDEIDGKKGKNAVNVKVVS